MKNLFLMIFTILFLASVGTGIAQEDIVGCPVCPICGMNKREVSQNRMLIEYDDNTTVGTCSIHCTAVEFAAHREKTLKRLLVSDYLTKKLIDAKRTYWVVGGNEKGVMTVRAKWAFERKEDAEKFIVENGGEIAAFDAAMKASFEDMYADLKMIRSQAVQKHDEHADMKKFPECGYCGMDRRLYTHSRALIEYADGTASGTCSIHCAAIDLVVNANKMPKSSAVADYKTKKLIDAEKAVWVMGGTKPGVMTVRAKWAFEKREDAVEFIRENGGRFSTFDEVMKATFEDMYDILR